MISAMQCTSLFWSPYLLQHAGSSSAFGWEAITGHTPYYRKTHPLCIKMYGEKGPSSMVWHYGKGEQASLLPLSTDTLSGMRSSIG
jgi:hypothetical protein